MCILVAVSSTSRPAEITAIRSTNSSHVPAAEDTMDDDDDDDVFMPAKTNSESKPTSGRLPTLEPGRHALSLAEPISEDSAMNTASKVGS